MITEKNIEKNVIIFEDFEKKILKTKIMNEILNKFDASNSIMIIDKISMDNIYKSAKNIPNIKVTDINHFSCFDLAKYRKVIFTETSIKELEKKYI